MKFKGVFIVVIIALMAGMILFEIKAPSRFQWEDYSQSYRSKQPFGCYVMDSVLHASLPQGYDVLGAGIELCFADKSKGVTHTFLFINNYNELAGSADVDLLKLIKQGNNVIIADESPYFYDDLEEKLGFSFKSNIYLYDNYKTILSDSTRFVIIKWQPDGNFTTANYLVSSAFTSYSVSAEDSYRTLATISWAQETTDETEPYDDTSTDEYTLTDEYTVTYDDDEEDESYCVVAAVRNYGKGKVVVVSMPLIFTNYGILDDNIRPMVLRLLSECGDKPVVRYDPTKISKVVKREEESDSPLRYLLAHRPLRWALYLALATLVAFVFFSARRRQRVVPVIKPPVNHMMDFVKRIGGIYYKQHDNVDLLSKRYATFSNDLRAQAMIDIDDADNLDDELQLLSTRTGIPFNELQNHILEIKDAISAYSLSNDTLRHLIDVMNDIMHRINI